MGKQRQPLPNRGRLQAQGPDTEESVAWNREQTPTKREMLAMLDELWAKLSRREQQEREECLTAARSYIQQCPATGVAAEFAKTFRNRKLRRGVRIDLEVRAGSACVNALDDR